MYQTLDLGVGFLGLPAKKWAFTVAYSIID